MFVENVVGEDLCTRLVDSICGRNIRCAQDFQREFASKIRGQYKWIGFGDRICGQELQTERRERVTSLGFRDKICRNLWNLWKGAVDKIHGAGFVNEIHKQHVGTTFTTSVVCRIHQEESWMKTRKRHLVTQFADRMCQQGSRNKFLERAHPRDLWSGLMARRMVTIRA